MEQTTPTPQQSAREEITNAIITRIREELEELIASRLPEEPEEVREALRQEILPHTRHVLSALSIKELIDPDSLQSHRDNCLATARYFIHCVEFKRSRS